MYIVANDRGVSFLVEAFHLGVSKRIRQQPAVLSTLTTLVDSGQLTRVVRARVVVAASDALVSQLVRA
jgi:hypothetical protein